MSTKARVALFMGAWIEITKKNLNLWIDEVALFMGAWIEIILIR